MQDQKPKAPIELDRTLSRETIYGPGADEAAREQEVDAALRAIIPDPPMQH